MSQGRVLREIRDLDRKQGKVGSKSRFQVSLQAIEVLHTALDISGDVLAPYLMERTPALVERSVLLLLTGIRRYSGWETPSLRCGMP